MSGTKTEPHHPAVQGAGQLRNRGSTLCRAQAVPPAPHIPCLIPPPNLQPLTSMSFFSAALSFRAAAVTASSAPDPAEVWEVWGLVMATSSD